MVSVFGAGPGQQLRRSDRLRDAVLHDACAYMLALLSPAPLCARPRRAAADTLPGLAWAAGRARRPLPWSRSW
jgi:hypothetical protein